MPKILRASEMSKCIGCFTCMNVCAAANHNNHSMLNSAIRIRTIGGMSGKFSARVCLGCLHPACAEVCPAEALSLRKGGGVNLKRSKCIGCGKCEAACSAFVVHFDEENKPIICHHCGICARFCPHGCLKMEESE